MFKNKKVTLTIVGVIVVVVIAVSLLLFTKGSKKDVKTSSSSSSTTKVEKATNNVSGRSEADNWYFKGSTYKAGNLKFEFGKSEVVNDFNNKKAFVIHAKMTNVSNVEMDSSAMYSVVSAYQKTDTQNKQLDPAMITDEPISTEMNNLGEKLLPGKSIDVAVTWNTVNDSDVTVKFENASFQELGTKTYSIK